MTPFVWQPGHVAAITAAAPGPASVAPVIAADAVPPVIPGRDLWDHWPVLAADGSMAAVAGGTLVIALTAPRLPDPDARHAVARLWLLHRGADGWRDLGPLLPDGFSPGSREWAGSALLDTGGERLTLYFTAAGQRGESLPSFGQRMLETSARIAVAGSTITLDGWSRPREMVLPDGDLYEADMAGGGAIGTIKAFRDPFVFTHGARRIILFAGSSARSRSAWNGAVGIAEQHADRWRLLPPIVTATGLNNELERPHVVAHGGQIYLFWSTQHKVFAPTGPRGPTGLYGIVASDLAGPWRPLNGTGLVIANPAAAPAQAYSWQVLPDLTVWSFADLVGLPAPPASPADARAHFAGTPAPVLRLTLTDDRTALV